MRKCLSCDCNFDSAGPQNRICEPCKQNNAQVGKNEGREVKLLPSEQFKMFPFDDNYLPE